MPWLQLRLAITPEQAPTYEDVLLDVGAVSVTFMDAEDQPIFEPTWAPRRCGATPTCWRCSKPIPTPTPWSHTCDC